MDGTTARLEARLLGGFDLRIDGRPVDLPSRPARSLLAYLMTTSGTMHRREKLAAMFWPDSDEENGRSYLRHALWRIRKALAADTTTDAPFVATDEFSVGFDPSASYWLDVMQFERSEDGADVYRGELLPGVLDEWAVLERERLEAILPAKMRRFVDRLSAEQRWSEVVERAERWIAFGGVPEAAYRALMTAHAALGDRASVAAAYRRCAEALKRDLDVEPSDQTRELYDAISRQAPTDRSAPAPAVADAVRAPTASETSPFKGLQHFDEGDAGLFFGREAVVASVVERLRTTSFLALIGASGSGKSSILRAGVVPALRAGDRPVHVITPTAHPLEALAVGLTVRSRSTAATTALLDDLVRDPRSLRLHLRKTRSRPVLVLDQFEELFTLCRDAFEREAFLDNVLAAALPDPDAAVTVVVALRADFYVHCADHEGLRDAVAQRQEFIGPMSERELREAIVRPAANGGWLLEPGLADLLLQDVGDEPGALPLLSHALLETWHRRRGRTLTLEGYAASGRVRGAIARTAESVYARLSEDDQRLARRIFLRLTEFGEGTQDTRRRASADELATGARDTAAVDAVVKVLADARLLTTSEGGVEVAHEALIREWPRLRQWLDEDRESLRVQRELTRAAREWERLGRDAGALYRGVRLAQTRELADAAPDELNELERAFVEASAELADREERERESARQRELDAAHRLAETERSAAVRLRRRALYLTIALFFLAGMAGAAVYFADRARASTAAAEREERRALLDSARVAAAEVERRVVAVADAISVPNVRGTVYEMIRTSDPRVVDTLRTMQQFTGDIAILFAADYRTNEILALPFASTDMRARAERARSAVSGSAPDAVEGCRRYEQATPIERNEMEIATQHAPVYRSSPYRPAAGDAPSVAMVMYGLPCRGHALIAEVSLRRAGEWMAPALARDDDALLVDGSGRLLARARGADVDHLRDLSGAPMVVSSLTSTARIIEGLPAPLGGAPVIAATAPVGEGGWRIIVVRPAPTEARQLEASLEQLRLIGAVLAALLIVIAGVILGARRPRRPIG